jgi:hypothetical protein
MASVLGEAECLDSEVEDEGELVRECMQLDRISLFFYDPSQPKSLGHDRTLLRASRVEQIGQVIRVFGPIGTPSSCCTDEAEVYVDPEALIVDVRAAPEDEPRLLNLIGARLRDRSAVGRFFLPLGAGGAFCDLRRPTGEFYAHTPVEQVIEELHDLEVLRRNAELLKYQKQLCSMMMNSQRKRFLGCSAP